MGEVSPSSLDSLRASGADRFDPVRFRFLEALARRSEACGDDARPLVEGRLAAALADYGERFEAARREAGDLLKGLSRRFPAAADELEALYGAGDFGGLRRLGARLEARQTRTSLADLTARLSQQPEPAQPGAPLPAPGTAALAPPAELKAVSYFRDTWSRLSMDRELAEALARAPENAGPLNSHLLVLNALKVMRDVSPDYLNRFMAYADALLWLERADGAGMPAAKGAPREEGEKKRKAARPRKS